MPLKDIISLELLTPKLFFLLLVLLLLLFFTVDVFIDSLYGKYNWWFVLFVLVVVEGKSIEL